MEVGKTVAPETLGEFHEIGVLWLRWLRPVKAAVGTCHPDICDTRLKLFGLPSVSE